MENEYKDIYKCRCCDCAYLIEDEGEWFCEDYLREIHKIECCINMEWSDIMLYPRFVTGEILDTDEMLSELYDLGEHRYYAVPIENHEMCSDIYRTVSYDPETDEFVDTMGYPIYREGWIQEHDNWIIMEYEPEV